MNRLFSEKYIGYVFVAPWIVGFLIFTVHPIGYSLLMNFFRVTFTATGISMDATGFANFRSAMMDIEFIRKAMDFSIQSLISIPLIVILALVIALLLNLPIKGQGVFRTIFFLPVIISSGPVIDKLMDMGVMTLPTLSQYGFYHALLVSDFFLANVLAYVLNNIIVLLWFSGVQILIFLAALQKMAPQIYEAARIDGASLWEIFWKITLPNLSSIILVNIVYTTVVYAQSTLNGVIELISSHMFKTQTGFGYASALAWIYFLLVALILAFLSGIFMIFNKKSFRG